MSFLSTAGATNEAASAGPDMRWEGDVGFAAGTRRTSRTLTDASDAECEAGRIRDGPWEEVGDEEYGCVAGDAGTERDAVASHPSCPLLSIVFERG
jgi:hypothetical protein